MRWPFKKKNKNKEGSSENKPVEESPKPKNTEIEKPSVPEQESLFNYQFYWKNNINDGTNYQETNHHLVVDDNEVNRLVMVKYLKGYKLDEAENGLQALNKAKEDFHKYDIVWMDIRMPVMDGLEATQKLREMDYKGVIIGLTAATDQDIMKKCIQCGMTDIMLKPLNLDSITNLIKFYS